MTRIGRHPFVASGVRDAAGVEQCGRCPLPEPNEIHDLPQVDEETQRYENRRTGERE